MHRPPLAAILCVPALCALAWLVHAEGRSYRRALLKTRPDDLKARLIAAAEARPSAAPALAAPIAPPSEPARPVPPPAPEPAVEPQAPQATASTGPPSPPAPGPEPTPPPPPPPAPAGFVLPRDLLAMDREQEDRLGRSLDRYILGKHRTIDDLALRRRLLDAARPLRAARQRAEVADYTYRILDSDRVSAFSQFGGYIYINRGVFDLAASEAELQFVLAREIAHIDAKDCAKRVAEGVATDDPADPDPLARIVRLLASGLPEEAEYQADAWAYRQLLRLGHSPHQSLGFLRRYLGYVEQRQALEKPDPAAADRDPGLEDHWRTLPPAVDRLEKLRVLREP